MSESQAQASVSWSSRLTAMLIHLFAAGFYVASMIFVGMDWLVFGTLIVPFLVWINGRDDVFISFHWKQSLWYVIIVMMLLGVLTFAIMVWSVSGSAGFLDTFSRLDALWLQAEQEGMTYSIAIIITATQLLEEGENLFQVISGAMVVIVTLAGCFIPLRFAWLAVRGKQEKFKL